MTKFVCKGLSATCRQTLSAESRIFVCNLQTKFVCRIAPSFSVLDLPQPRAFKIADKLRPNCRQIWANLQTNLGKIADKSGPILQLDKLCLYLQTTACSNLQTNFVMRPMSPPMTKVCLSWNWCWMQDREVAALLVVAVVGVVGWCGAWSMCVVGVRAGGWCGLLVRWSVCVVGLEAGGWCGWCSVHTPVLRS